MGEFPLDGSGEVYSLTDLELCSKTEFILYLCVFIEPTVNWVYFNAVFGFLIIHSHFRGMIVCFFSIKRCVPFTLIFDTGS
jgi:hypothetical protein